MPPFIIPIFITHQGCPHRCIFCNQEGITGCRQDIDDGLSAGFIQEEIDRWLQRAKPVAREVQVAFYGGSFTGIPRARQELYLGAVRPFLDRGQVQSIRLSTRPDYIDRETGPFLCAHGVTTVELGVQSMDPAVLSASSRGHSVAHVERAFSLLRQSPLRVGGQLMIGLPGETTSGCMAGAARLAALRPDCLRIYPTLVLRGSGLERLWNQGRYRPISLARAVALTARMAEIFSTHRIPVIRIGLQPSADLNASFLAGPHHPAFGELVRSRSLFKRARALLHGSRGETNRCLLLAAADQSIFRGQKNYYLQRLRGLGLLDGVELVFSDGQPRGEVELKAECPLPAGHGQVCDDRALK